ncbi:MAG: hypothetical protein E7418_04580 [Ruminococcaceae bacterium]|nr:hypothetical protein [Oscillospiraceae bacterium]
MNKKSYFFIDDVIWVFRDLHRERPASLFDNAYMKGLKEAHDAYGLKVQLNVFYRTDFYYGMDEFSLAEMTDAYKEEWQANKDWIKFGFHSKQEFPDYPFVNADYDDVAQCYDMTLKEIIRFAGEGMFSVAVVPHWLPMSKDGCRALSDRGIRLIGVSYGDKEAYNGDPTALPYGHAQRLLNNRKPETGIFTRVSPDAAITRSICSYNHLNTEEVEKTFTNFDSIPDPELNLRYKRMCNGPILNLIKKEDVRQWVLDCAKGDLLSSATHEQYFYKDYLAYQPDYMEKIMIMAKATNELGYEYMFWDEIIDEVM